MSSKSSKIPSKPAPAGRTPAKPSKSRDLDISELDKVVGGMKSGGIRKGGDPCDGGE